MENFDKQRAISSATEFFDLLDQYLIEDLKTMIGEVQRDVGGLGYPAIQTTISGMELLGLLMSGGAEKDGGFNYFWSRYLVKSFPRYSGLNEIFYKVIRHGTAHIFLVKSGVSISKSGTNHLSSYEKQDRPFLNVDLKCLFSDFLSCYEEIKKDLLIVQDENCLNQFWKGFEKLFDQMQRAQQIVDQYLKNRTTSPQFPNFQPNTIAYNVSSSTLTSMRPLNASTMTLPPEHWFKKNEKEADQQSTAIRKNQSSEDS